ncbi:MAG: hypothetical protein LWW97_07645 [Deltaproteobacteria bacterium]|nr:hypothetical protein [Deltaproteobacteria bacterium]
MISKSELAREAKVSPITIARIEKNIPCRMETKKRFFGLRDLTFLIKTR